MSTRPPSTTVGPRTTAREPCSTGRNIPLSRCPAPRSSSTTTTRATGSPTTARRIATVPGSFQSELGCPGDWEPDCLRSWLQDPDGDGTYSFETTAIPAGSYEAKVHHQRELGRELRPGRRSGLAAEHPLHRPDRCTRAVHATTHRPHILTITGRGHGHDNNVEYDGLGHNSQDPHLPPAVRRGQPGHAKSPCASAPSTTTSQACGPASMTRRGRAILPGYAAGGNRRLLLRRRPGRTETCDY